MADRVTTPSDALLALLRALYTEGEIAVWLRSPQPMFGGAVALDMIAAGREGDLIRALRHIEEGAYV